MKFNSNFSENSEKSLGFSFIKVYNIWHQKIKNSLLELDLTHPQFVVLATLGHLQLTYEEITQVMISKNSNIDVMTVSQILKNLLKKELIVRREHSKDTRAKTVNLTDLGIEKMNKALNIVERVDQDFFGILSNLEKKELNAIFLVLEGKE